MEASTMVNAGFRRCLLVAALAIGMIFGAGCGVSSTDGAPGWQIAGIGPAGGSVAAGDVLLTLVPGALAQETAVSILPEARPLTIQKSPNDPCIYTFLGPLWCCGPVGHDLLAASTLRVSYDESLIPAGFTETDLVLLEWNDALGVLEPNLNATQDTTANYFENTSYMQLGHLAVGVRDCSQAGGKIVVAGNANVVAAPTDGMYVTDIDGVDSTFLSGELPSVFVPSSRAGRILLQLFDPSNESESLGTVPIAGGATVVVAADTDNLTGGDPRFGWLLQSSTDRVFFTHFVPAAPQAASVPAAVVSPNQNQDVLVRRSADASDAITPIHGIDQNSAFIQDIRQSPTGAHFLIRRTPFQTEGGDEIDVVETETGVVVSSGLIPAGGGQHTPRFTPDGTGIYLVDSLRTSVVRYDLDGTNDQIIFSFGPGNIAEQIQDAVLAADGQTLAVISRGPNTDLLYLATADVPMMGIVRETLDLGSQPFYDEVVWNPVAAVLYIDSARGAGVRAFGMDPAAALGSRITDHGLLPALDMRLMDIDRLTGDLLHLTLSQQTIGNDLASRAATLGPGVCVTDSTGGNLRVQPPLGLTLYAARWLDTFRTTPGMFTDLVR